MEDAKIAVPFLSWAPEQWWEIYRARSAPTTPRELRDAIRATNVIFTLVAQQRSCQQYDGDVLIEEARSLNIDSLNNIFSVKEKSKKIKYE